MNLLCYNIPRVLSPAVLISVDTVGPVSSGNGIAGAPVMVDYYHVCWRQ